MKIAVFGAGIAGLAAAHELSRLGHDVTVYEATGESGGFFRSARRPEHDGMPSEYSWHGLGPWYHNTFDVMRDTPFDARGSVYDRCLSRPIDFGIAPPGPASVRDVFDGGRMYRMSMLDRLGRAWLTLRSWLANERSEQVYAAQNASEAWRPYLSHAAWSAWRETFGPWIGSDWTNVSLHTAARFFLKNIYSGAAHAHPADELGPAWSHGGSAEWLLLRGPSSEVWFERWVRHLESRGVRFAWNSPLERLVAHFDEVGSALLLTGEEVFADGYVLATTPFAAAEIVKRSGLWSEELQRLPRLVERGPHAQMSFRIAFSERVMWPRDRAAVIVGGSRWNLTLFAQEQVWAPGERLGDGVASLWTGTACACTVPGVLYELPATQCTREQFIDEVLEQIRRCGGLESVLEAANAGRCFDDFERVRVEVWHEWQFSPSGAAGAQPKWVNDTTTQPHQPSQRSGVPNLAFAGAHTRTSADLWSIEAAVESGRRAAKVFDPRAVVLEQTVPAWMRAVRRVDDVLYRAGLPHAIDVAASGLAGAALALVAWVLW